MEGLADRNRYLGNQCRLWSFKQDAQSVACLGMAEPPSSIVKKLLLVDGI